MRVKELDRVLLTYPAGVKFHPFVGEKYRNSHYGVRLLVLGESHYGDGDDTAANFTQNVIRDHAYCAGFPFFSKLTNVLRGCTDWPTDEERRETWQQISCRSLLLESPALRPRRRCGRRLKRHSLKSCASWNRM